MKGPTPQRIASGAVAVAAAFVGLKIWLSVGVNSLWIDEFYTMGWAYVPTHAPTRGPHALPIGMTRWLLLLSTDVDPHFPTIYGITRVISDAIQFDGIALEHFVRLPLVITIFLVCTLFISTCLKGRPDTQGAFLVSAIMLCLVLDHDWRQHSAEARMYGLMTVTGIAMVCAIQSGRLAMASWLGLALALLHPFGAMLGFAPAMVTLVVFPRQLSRRGWFTLLGASLLTACLVCAWMIAKFILKSASGYTAGGGSADILKVLSGLNLYAAGAAFALATACLVVFRKVRETEFRCAFLFLAILLSGLISVGLLLALKPTTPPYERYVRWANPVLLAMATICVLMLARQVRPTLLRAALVPLTLCASVASVAVARATPFGPPWGNSLREAAQYLNAVADDRSVVTHDTFEIFDLPTRFRTGFRCFRGGQSVAYLSPAVRERMPCQSGNDVAIPADVQQVYLIREPIAWAGPRRIHLDPFDKTATIAFGSAAIDVYRRRAE